MKCQMPQISWHGRDPVLSVDFQVIQGDIRRLASGGTDGHVVIWYVTVSPKNSVSVECACDLSRHNKSVNVVRFSPNGELLASGDDEGAIITWKLREKTVPSLDSFEVGETNKEDWAPFKILRGHIDDICDISWSQNSEFLLSGSIDNCIFIWDVSKGQNIRMSKDAKGFVQGVAWDPLNQYFATLSSDRMLRIHNASSKKVVHRVHKAPWSQPDENGVVKPSKLFHDDTLKSFCRRLTFTPDGELLFVPSGIKEKDEKQVHTTYVFSRYDLARPVVHLPTGSKYTLAVRCCPTLFKLRVVKNGIAETPMVKLPYRVLIAVATQDGIFLYDTQQLLPFAYVSNIHYAHLTDIAWSSDGRLLIVSSTDGYCSFVIFSDEELGEIYVPPVKEPVKSTSNNTPEMKSVVTNHAQDSPKQASENDAVDIKDTSASSPSNSKTPSPRKMKTPKKIVMPPKKTPKMCTIKKFFSLGKEKIKTSISHDSVTTGSPKSNDADKVVSSKDDTADSRMDCDEVSSTAVEPIKDQSSSTSNASSITPHEKPVDNHKKNLDSPTNSIEDIEMADVITKPSTKVCIDTVPAIVITLDDDDTNGSAQKKLRLDDTPSSAKSDKMMKIYSFFKSKSVQKNEDVSAKQKVCVAESKSPSKEVEIIQKMSDSGVAASAQSSICPSDPEKSEEKVDPPPEKILLPEETKEVNSVTISPAQTVRPSIVEAEKPKKRVQLITLSNKVTS